MVDAEILRRRVDALLDYLSRLEPFAAMDRQRFIANREDHHLAERYLHLAIESDLYLDIDHGITWDTIRNDLGDPRRLAEIAAAKL